MQTDSSRASVKTSVKSRATAKTDANKQSMTSMQGEAKETLHLNKPAETVPSVDELVNMIATAAYYCAEQRSFEPGHELEDWFAAEHQIKARFG